MKIIELRKRPSFLSKLVMNVLAEELNEEQGNGTETTPPATKVEETTVPQPNGTVNFEELIAKARKEERDKLYPQIEKLKKDKNDLLLTVAERDKEIAELNKAVTNLQKDFSKVNEEVKEGTKTNKVVQEQSLTISQLEQEIEELQAKYETEVQSLKVSAYRDKLIASAGGEIIPELVTGNTEEEINASIELAKQKYAEIQEKALASVQMPRSVNPSVATIHTNVLKSTDDIRSMSASDWAKTRKELGLK